MGQLSRRLFWKNKIPFEGPPSDDDISKSELPSPFDKIRDA
jgi:hypothetical protein